MVELRRRRLLVARSREKVPTMKMVPMMRRKGGKEVMMKWRMRSIGLDMMGG